MATNMSDPKLSISEGATLLGVSTWILRGMIARRECSCYRIGPKRVLISQSEIHRILRDTEQPRIAA